MPGICEPYVYTCPLVRLGMILLWTPGSEKGSYAITSCFMLFLYLETNNNMIQMTKYVVFYHT